MNQRYFTQWSGQFYVAYELTKRGYTVTFTLGTAQNTDLTAISPKGKTFRIEVKSLKKDNYWFFKYPTLTSEDDFWFFVITGEIGDSPSIAIMSGAEVKREWEYCYDYDCRHNPSNLRYDKFKYSLWGIKQGVMKKYRERIGWNMLPK
jgi:hypothetical protein